MAFQAFRWSRMTLILAIVGLCCFMFAGAALAVTNTLEVYANGQQDNMYTGCSNVGYTFNINDIDQIPGLTADCFNSVSGNVYGGSEIIIKFTKGLNGPVGNFTIEPGQSVPVKIYVQGIAEPWIFAQPTPTVVGPGHVSLKLPPLQIPNSAGKYVTKIVIGDNLQNLQVTNPCLAGDYCADIRVNTYCSGQVVFTKIFTVESAPSSIDVEVGCGSGCIDLLACSDCLTVSGMVLDCVDQQLETTPVGVPNQPISISVQRWELVNPATQTWAWVQKASATSTTNALGAYNVPGIANLPPSEQGQKYRAVVSTVSPCGGVVAGTSREFQVNKNVPTNMTISVKDWDGVAGQLRYNKCNEVTICIKDTCGYNAAFTQSTELTLSAFIPGNPPVVAGHFYLVCPDNPGATTTVLSREAGQINTVTFAPGESCKKVYLIPIYEGNLGQDIEITIEGKIAIPNLALKKDIKVMSIAPSTVDLEITPLVTDDSGKPRAGWPLAAAVRMNKSASENYPVVFTAKDANGAPVAISFDDEKGLSGGNKPFVKAYGCEGDNKATYPYCQKKWYFFVYTDKSVIGKTLTITVDVGGMKDEFTVGPFVTPVELQRDLKPDAWQVFSTPKWLAKPCTEPTGNALTSYGTFDNFLPFDFNDSIVLYVKGGVWQIVTNGDLPVVPLTGYYVRTPQREQWTTNDYDPEYVFARAVNPGQQAPFMDPVVPVGWNTAGVAVNPALQNTPKLQSDSMSHAFGSILNRERSFLLWNPGSKLGNINDPPFTWTTLSLTPDTFDSYMYDTTKSVYNGDLYWLYNGNAIAIPLYSANVGLDLIEWAGANSQYTAPTN